MGLVFTSNGLFARVSCPYGSTCKLVKCVFSHDAEPEVVSPTAVQEPQAKRRKVENDDQGSRPKTRPSDSKEYLQQMFKREKTPSPPPSISVAAQEETVESLNPRLIANDPVGHARRALFLKHLHAQMVKLNEKLTASGKSELIQTTALNDQQLIRLALDQEEQLVREHAAVYPNRMKSCIKRHKDMSLDQWVVVARAALENRTQSAAAGRKNASNVDTGLSSEQEQFFLSLFLADQTPLEPFGYISTPPAAHKIAEAEIAVQMSANYESCDRCGARFQVFPGASSSEPLTSKGPCRHHPNRKSVVQTSSTDHYTGRKDAYHLCCNLPVGSDGCDVKPHHVFKTEQPGRLAAVLPFITTPQNAEPQAAPSGKLVTAVVFDCEMSYTVFGTELVRLTALTWPDHEELLDVLVRPLGHVLDYNSRFSGVTAEQYDRAVDHEKWTPELRDHEERPLLRLAQSPQHARQLLCRFITPNTPLIGHAIENDLKAVRLCHPSIIDTMLLFAHRRGLPYRTSLKQLASEHLSHSIQGAGADGHDSREDASATGELVRAKVRQVWRRMKSSGWHVTADQLSAPQHSTLTFEQELDRVGFPFSVAVARDVLKRKKLEETQQDREIRNSVAKVLQRSREDEPDQPQPDTYT